MIKSIIASVLSKMGYSVTKNKRSVSEDMDLYIKIYGARDVRDRRFYNIGAGLFRHPAWINVDYYSDWYKGNTEDINFNLLECKELPVETDSANVVYSSHTIEHITDEAVMNMFREAYRILKPGGYIRITTPNIELYYKTVLNNDLGFWQKDIVTFSNKESMQKYGLAIPMNEVSVKQLFLFGFASQTSILHIDSNVPKITDDEFEEIFLRYPFEEALDFCKSKCRLDIQAKFPGNHINWWSGEKARRMLEKAGFKMAYQSAYGQSLCPVLRNTTFFDNHPEVSLYYEARKS